MLRADGPLPMTTSSLKSSRAGYSTSSTARGIRWTSSTNRTSPSSRLVRIAARSAGPLQGRARRRPEPDPDLVGDDAGQRGLAQARRAGNRTWSRASPRRRAPSTSRASCSLIRSLADELREPPGSEGGVELPLLLRRPPGPPRAGRRPRPGRSPSHALQRLAQELLDGPVAVAPDPGQGVAGLLRRQPQGEEGFADLGDRPRRLALAAGPDPVLEVEDDPRRPPSAPPPGPG